MPIYTFYPTQADGLAPSFDAFELPDDDAASDRALRLLEEHGSCSSVVVWDGGRRVLARHRAELALP